MIENNDNNSFTKRFTNRTSSDIGEGFSNKYSSKSTKKHTLEKKGKISQLANKKTEFREAFSERSRIKNKSRTFNERSFAKITKKSRSDLIYLVRGKDRGRLAWHYVLVDKDKREIFLAKSRTGSIDVADYGEVLYSGWGEDPPQKIVDKINEEFGL